MRQFLSAQDVPSIEELIHRAQLHKQKPFEMEEFGYSKTIINLFFNPSLRTRISTVAYIAW